MDDILVTAEHPARPSNSGMDHARCAALHNYLVRYAWLAEGRSLDSLQTNNSFFTTCGEDAEAVRSRLEPSVVAFLETAVIPSPNDDGGENDPSAASLFWFVSGLSDPDFFFANDTADLFDQPPDTLLCLYFPNIGQGGEFGGGLFYHQRHHLATVFMHMDDYDFALPLEAHSELWHPLEMVLSNWIELIHVGKVVASPREHPSLYGSEKIGPWEWRPFGEGQIRGCVDTWHRLCETIEGRISPSLSSPSTSPPTFEPLLPYATLDAASVPQDGFARAFLTRARRPRFKQIAPGLILPPTDPTEFTKRQPYTELPRESENTIPPVLLFSPADPQREADLTSLENPFCSTFRQPARVPAGVYSEAVERDAYDNAEEGFRLLLPYSLEGREDDDDNDAATIGARKSDGSYVNRGSVADLFLHGYKPFGGDYGRAQRLERLFDQWCTLVDKDVWEVGPEGVLGTIDDWKKAYRVRWRDYCIPPAW